jgi:hypothetical protein
MGRTIFLCVFIFNVLSLTAVYAEDSITEDNITTEESITTFDKDWTFSLFSNYNLGLFTQTDTSQYRTNKPWDIGLGLRYKIFSAKISFAIPITALPNAEPSPTKSSSTKPSFDFEFASYFDKMYFEAYIKYYRDYYVRDTSEPGGLDTLSSGVMATYVQNYKNHSMSSVIKLDKKQNISSGSFLYSFGAFLTSLYSTSEKISNYHERQNFIYFGPGIGYSYIWVFENGLFLNASLILLTNAGYNITAEKWLFIPQMEPNFVVGYHQATWSFNIRVMNKTTVLLGNTAFLANPVELDFNVLTLMTISIMFSKRF